MRETYYRIRNAFTFAWMLTRAWRHLMTCPDVWTCQRCDAIMDVCDS